MNEDGKQRKSDAVNRKATAPVLPLVILKQLRQAVADYMSSEGCSCCQDSKAHEKHTAILGKLLKVEKYSDKSGYNFRKYRSK